MKKGNWGSLVFLIIVVFILIFMGMSAFSIIGSSVLLIPFILVIIVIFGSVIRSIVMNFKNNKNAYMDKKEVFSEQIDENEEDSTEDVVDNFRREANFRGGATITKKYSYMNPKTYRMSFYIRYLDSSTNSENTESVSKDIYDLVRKGMSIPVKKGFAGVKIDKKKIKEYNNE